MQMAKVKIEGKLLERAKEAADKAGYSSVEEFVTYLVEKSIAEIEAVDDGDGEAVAKQLRGLGYIE
jgi:metal-responsive CopG/Arc/MetJ family transcriptional regulator